jgi:hypothetical protein
MALDCPAVARLDWQALAKAAMHPMQVRILERAAAGEKLTPVRLAEEMGEKLGNTAYHVRCLHDRGLLKKAGTKQVRGAVAHYYVIAENALR